MQTIHAFCTRLLHQFPFEANVAARFTVLDEASTTQLLNHLTLQVLLDASAHPDSALGKALATAIVVSADQTFKEVIGDAIRKRDTLLAWIVRAGSIDKAIAELSASLGIAPGDTLESLEQDFFTQSLIPAGEWPALIEVLEFGLGQRQETYSDTWSCPRRVGPRTHQQLSQGVLHRRARTAPEYRHQEDRATAIPTGWHGSWPNRTASASCWSASARSRARERTRALITIAADVIAR